MIFNPWSFYPHLHRTGGQARAQSLASHSREQLLGKLEIYLRSWKALFTLTPSLHPRWCWVTSRSRSTETRSGCPNLHRTVYPSFSSAPHQSPIYDRGISSHERKWAFVSEAHSYFKWYVLYYISDIYYIKWYITLLIHTYHIFHSNVLLQYILHNSIWLWPELNSRTLA